MARKENPEAKLVAELLDPGQRLYLENSGADSVVSIGDVGGFLLAEAVGEVKAAILPMRWLVALRTVEVQHQGFTSFANFAYVVISASFESNFHS